MPRVRPGLARLGTATLALAGVVMATDVVWWLATRRLFLLLDPT